MSMTLTTGTVYEDEYYVSPVTPINQSYTERDFKLYEAIIVRGNKTVAATTRIEKSGKFESGEGERKTFAEHGLPERR